MGTLTFVFCIAELVTGILTGSLALLADAFHMVSDEISLIVGFVALRLAERQKTFKMSYGWRRAEVIGGCHQHSPNSNWFIKGMVNGVFLLSVAIFIMLEAAQRFIDLPGILLQ